MNNSTAFCPQCKKDIAFAVTDGTRTCPECGFQSHSEERRPLSGRSRARRGWLIFFLVMFAPALLTFGVLTAGADLDLGAGIAFVGSGVSALFCGIFCASRTVRDLVWRFIVAVLLIAVFYGVCFVLCFAGCSAASVFRSIPL